MINDLVEQKNNNEKDRIAGNEHFFSKKIV